MELDHSQHLGQETGTSHSALAYGLTRPHEVLTKCALSGETDEQIKAEPSTWARKTGVVEGKMSLMLTQMFKIPCWPFGCCLNYALTLVILALPGDGFPHMVPAWVYVNSTHGSG